MSATDRATADQVLGRVAQTAGEACDPGRGIELTWGAAELEPGGNAEDLLAAADVALLERKTEKQR
jgi:PleD family two-component response regulator